MTRLALALADFTVPLEADAAPRLATLERFLARGRRQGRAATSWRHWLMSRAGATLPEELPLGPALAGADEPCALATPVHLLAGLEHVHFDPTGVPALGAADWQRLADSFAAEFAQDGLALRCVAGQGLLSLPRGLEVRTHDPHGLAGRDAGRWLPSGADGAWLRRAMTSFEMWLHDHPLNRERAARGLVPVNALWAWGAGSRRWSTSKLEGRILATDDVPLRRAWEQQGGATRDLPGSFAAWDPVPGAECCIGFGLSGLDPDPRVALALLEDRWLAPMQEALDRGALAEAALYLDGTELRFRRRDRLRFWRRPQAWYEALR